MECRQMECSSWSPLEYNRKEATEAIQAPRPQIIHLPLTPRWRHVTRTDLRKYGCSACSDIAVHGKTLKLHTEESRNRIGKQMQHDPGGHERLQAHKRRRDVEPEIEANRAPVARENEGDPRTPGTTRCSNAGRGICVCETWIGRCGRQ